MEYSEDFKQRVLSVFQNSSPEYQKKISGMLESGNEFLGRYLDDSRYNSISSKEIVEAIESNNLQDIYLKAKRQLAIEELYQEWGEMYENQHKSQGLTR